MVLVTEYLSSSASVSSYPKFGGCGEVETIAVEASKGLRKGWPFAFWRPEDFFMVIPRVFWAIFGVKFLVKLFAVRHFLSCHAPLRIWNLEAELTGPISKLNS